MHNNQWPINIIFKSLVIKNNYSSTSWKFTFLFLFRIGADAAAASSYRRQLELSFMEW